MKNCLNCIYFTFSFINGCYIFFIFNCITFSKIINVLSLIFFQSVVNNTFSNLKLIVFIFTGFICSNKEVKQVVLINYTWIFSTLHRGWAFEFSLFSKKVEEGEVVVDFAPKRGCYYERVTYDCCVSLCL